ncbi:hypothetical protein [Salinibaculum rarum]|uniref:hypothetical protein n=1 Tax=Salinibaculum rarum TaxID=3058903 RepID=UPI00265E5B82|nr:hypothetical protein [Salinibaculum sp. KK48]
MSVKQHTQTGGTEDKQQYAVRMFYEGAWVTLHENISRQLACNLQKLYGSLLEEVGYERNATILSGNVHVDTVDGLGSDGPHVSDQPLIDAVADALEAADELHDKDVSLSLF